MTAASSEPGRSRRLLSFSNHRNCPCHFAQKPGSPRNRVFILEPHSPPEMPHFLLLHSNPRVVPICFVLRPAGRATFPESPYAPPTVRSYCLFPLLEVLKGYTLLSDPFLPSPASKYLHPRLREPLTCPSIRFSSPGLQPARSNYHFSFLIFLP